MYDWDLLTAELPKLRQIAYNMTGHRDKADQLLESTILKLTTNIQVGKNPAIIAFYKALFDTWCEKAGTQASSNENQQFDAPNGALPLSEAVLALPPEDRFILILHHTIGFTYEDCAIVTGHTPAEIRQIIKTIISRLTQQPKSMVLVLENKPVLTALLTHRQHDIAHLGIDIESADLEHINLERKILETLPSAILINSEGMLEGLDTILQKIDRLWPVPTLLIADPDALPPGLISNSHPNMNIIIINPLDEETLPEKLANLLNEKTPSSTLELSPQPG